MELTIYRSGAANVTIHVGEDSTLTQKLMGEEYVHVHVTNNAVWDITVGDYITVDSRNYYLNSLPDIRKLGSNLFEYDMYFEARFYDLLRASLLMDDVSEFSFVGNPDTFIDLIVTNLDRVFGASVWTKGTVDTGNTRFHLMHFKGDTCLSALQRLASEFDGEYYFSPTTATVIRFTDAVGVASGLSFSYGSAGGLDEISRTTLKNSSIITRLYAYGSNRNIDVNYRGGKRRLQFDNGGNNYLESNIGTYGTIEHVEFFDDIYPQYEGALTAITDEDEYTDSGLDFNINDYLIGAITPKLHFYTGDCAGYSFEISSYNHTNKLFNVIPIRDEFDLEIPNATLNPATGDSYTVLDIIMPTCYVTVAENALEAAAQALIDARDTPVVSYSISPYWRYLKDAGATLNIGDTITVTDTDLGISETTRIVELVRPLTSEYKYKIEVSNEISADIIERTIANLGSEINKSNVDGAGQIDKATYGAWNKAGQYAGRVFQTDSGLAGHKQRIILNKDDNTMEWRDANDVTILKIGDAVGPNSDDGIIIVNGCIALNEGTDASYLTANYLEISQVTESEVVYILNTYNGAADAVSVYGLYTTTSTSAAAKDRIGIKGEVIIINGSNDNDAIGVYGGASSTGTGAVYSGYFTGGGFVVKLGDAAGTNKISILDSAGEEQFYVNSSGTLYNRGIIACAENISCAAGKKLLLDGSAGITYFIHSGTEIQVFVDGTETMTIGDDAVGFFQVAPQSQQAHIINADGTLADITTKFNTLLADLEGYGLLANT